MSDDKLWIAALVVCGLIGFGVAVSSLAGFVLVAGLGLLAVVPASIADGRGHHRLAWYLYGLLLFPVAVGHALMLPSSDEPAASSGDRQLRALVGAAAAVFIALCLGFVVTGMATEGSTSENTDYCYDLAEQAELPENAADRVSLLRAAADCLDP